MDAPRGGGGHTRRPGPSGPAADQRRAAAAQAMARMEEMMLAHAGAAGEFSIILDAPLPSLQQYRRNPAPPSGASSASSSTNSSPIRRGAQGGGGRDEGVPARLRRDGSGHVDPDTAARTARRGAVGGTAAVSGAARQRAGGARSERDQEETVEAPVRLTDPRTVRRPVSRGVTPPPRAAEVRRVAAQEEEEETPLQLLARDERSSSATRPAEQASETVPTARPSSRRSRRDVGVKQVVSEVTSNVDSDVESVGRWSSRGSEDGGDEPVSLHKPLTAIVARDRSRSNSPAISNVKDVSLPFAISCNSFEQLGI